MCTASSQVSKVPGSVADKLVLQRRYGQKAKKGFYDYPDGRTPVRDPQVEQLIVETSAELGMSGCSMYGFTLAEV